MNTSDNPSPTGQQVIYKSITLYPAQVSALAALEAATGKNQSALVRQAIDLLAAQMPLPTTNEPAAQGQD